MRSYVYFGESHHEVVALELPDQLGLDVVQQVGVAHAGGLLELFVGGGHLVLHLFVGVGVGPGLGEDGLGVSLGHVDGHVSLVIGRHELGLQLYDGLVLLGVGLLDVLLLDLTLLDALFELVRQVHRAKLEEFDGGEQFVSEHVVEGVLHLDSDGRPVHEELVGGVEGGLLGEDVDGVLLEYFVVLVLEGHVETEEVFVVESVLEGYFDRDLEPVGSATLDGVPAALGVPGELDGLEGAGVLDEGVAQAQEVDASLEGLGLDGLADARVVQAVLVDVQRFEGHCDQNDGRDGGQDAAAAAQFGQ